MIVRSLKYKMAVVKAKENSMKNVFRKEVRGFIKLNAQAIKD